jgi:mercuric reductase
VDGAARFVDPSTVETDGKRLTGSSFLIATGSRPIIPNIPGLDDVPYLTSDLLTHGEDGELRDLPESLIIVGGGYIALELGQMFARLGSSVTILERDPQLLAIGYEPQLGRMVARVFAEEGIRVETDAEVTSVRPEKGGVVVTAGKGGNERTFRAEKILVAAGRRPNTDDIGLDAVGIQVTRDGAIEVDKYLRTNVPSVFAAGDVIGSYIDSQMATPVGARQGGIAGHNAVNGNELRSFDGRVIPRAIFTDPQIGIVGVTEAELIGTGHRCWCTTLPMEIVPRAGAIHDTRGFIKLVADPDTNEVVGATMFGANAAEVIHEVAMGMHFHAKIEDFVELIHVYPTMAEALKIAAIARTKDPWRLSCCAE